jgi:hypothetical protein
MQLRIVNKLIKPGCLQRVFAIFFLLFTSAELMIVDIALPQRCKDELGMLATNGYAHPTTDETDKSFVIAENHSQPESSSEQNCTEEDCFCCCSHIVPASHVTFPPLIDEPQVTEAAIAHLPSSPPHGLFHPPRLS